MNTSSFQALRGSAAIVGAYSSTEWAAPVYGDIRYQLCGTVTAQAEFAPCTSVAQVYTLRSSNRFGAGVRAVIAAGAFVVVLVSHISPWVWLRM